MKCTSPRPKKKLHFVVHDFEPGYDTYTEKPGFSWDADIAFADVNPADYSALVIPSSRAPEYIRNKLQGTQKPASNLCLDPSARSKTMRTLPYVRCCVLVCIMMVMLGLRRSSAAQVSVGITVAFAPPDLPVYEQPLCPGERYLWTPGYWAWDEDYDDYYWVPGTWVLVPEVGFLWTPGYWAWGGSGFIFYEGYWSYELVGFYGGINYGYGYFGRGYEGGRWEGDRFLYNRAVNNVNITIIHNVYEAPVNPPNRPRVSYNGGNGGINDRPTPQEEAAARARQIPAIPVQRQHVQMARSNPQLRASVNRGKPPVAATPKPTAFNERGVVPAREAGAIHHPVPGNARAGNNSTRRTTAVHPNELPPIERPTPPNTGNRKLDRKYQQQQEKLYAQQEKERQKLQQQQEKEHQQLTRQNADQARRQQVEERHQQQTEQMVQRHSEQQQRLQGRQRPPSAPPREKH